MLLHPTLDKLRELRLSGMAAAFEEQLQQPEAESLSFEDRLGLLVDREELERTNRRLKYRLARAKLLKRGVPAGQAGPIRWRLGFPNRLLNERLTAGG